MFLRHQCLERMIALRPGQRVRLDRVEEEPMPGKVPQKPNQKKQGKSLKEKRAAKQAKKAAR
jgi:hypothetical protein